MEQEDPGKPLSLCINALDNAYSVWTTVYEYDILQKVKQTLRERVIDLRRFYYR